MAAHLDTFSASFHQAAIAASARATAALLEEHWGARVKTSLVQLCALRKLVEAVDARLTFKLTPLERQQGRFHPPPQGLYGDASICSAIDPYASFISPKTASTPPASASYVTGSGALPRIATHHPHTYLLSNTVHQPSMRLCTLQLSRGPPQLPATVLPPFTGRPVSPYPYQHPSPHEHPTPATAVPPQSQFPFFHNPHQPLHSPFTSAESHFMRKRRHGPPSARSTLFSLESNEYIR